ncbi:hypothetical protein GBF38_021773, partial [Nibea albiflora]
MMGYSKFWLLLLLSSYTLALTSRFKTNRKYMYQYTTESRNGVVGTASLRNGPKVSCQVEIEVPQPCSFIVHTRDCALSEVSVINPQGDLVYRQAASSEAFKAAMGKSALCFLKSRMISGPDQGGSGPRGQEFAKPAPSSTVHGHCLTDYTVNARKDIDTDVTLVRDLSQCDQFYSRELANSPLALLQKLHRPMSKLIISTQDCNYQFDHKGKHITTAMCTEKHVYLPFSHEDNGMSSVVTQELSFQKLQKDQQNIFQRKPLHFEDPDDKAPVQTKDAVLSSVRDLVALAGTDQGEKRTSLFHKLVSSLRVLRNETLSETVTEMFDVSGWLTWQALFQCGTPECTSAILQGIRTIDGVSLESISVYLTLSLVHRFHKGEVTSVVTDVAEFMKTLLNDCSEKILDNDYDFPADPKETSFLVLRVVGVMGQAMQDVSPSLMNSVLQCARKTDIPLPDQKAAIQALRLMNI